MSAIEGIGHDMRIAIATAVFCAIATAGMADGIADANAGLAALDTARYSQAVVLFTRAIEKGRLSSEDKELAYVKRAQAYAAQHEERKALADVNRALALKPDDKDAIAIGDALRVRSSGNKSATGPAQITAVSSAPGAQQAKTNEPIAPSHPAENEALRRYNAELAKYEADKQATESARLKMVEQYEASKKEAEAAKVKRDAAYQKELDSWRARVAACSKPDHSIGAALGTIGATLHDRERTCDK